MKNMFLIMVVLLLSSGMCVCAEVVTFHSYVDSDLCARLMLGQITPERIACSQKLQKQGSNLALVRLNDNTVFAVNKPKMLTAHVGKFAEVTGEAKVKAGTIKLQSINAEESSSIPQGDPARRLIDVRPVGTRDAAIYEKIRHELAMMPYTTVYDFISFTMVGNEVILSGWTIRGTNQSEAYNRVKVIQGVDKIINNIEILPLGSLDNQIRANARAKLQRYLPRYFWGSGSDIRIIVKNGNIILLGTVATQADSDLANLQCGTVPSAFIVFNLLRVAKTVDKAKN
jgi:hypothetical protein